VVTIIKTMINRTLSNILYGYMHKGKALVVIGARQVGKTTLLRKLVEQDADNTLWLNCDQSEVKNLLEESNLASLSLLIKNYKIVVVDEAQRVANIGIVLKLITDNFPDVQLMVTGSSSLELKNRLNEPLTGRKLDFNLYTISTAEIYETLGLIQVKELLDKRLVYGSYPDVLFGAIPPQKAVTELTQSYLYKDVLELDGLQKPAILNKILIALALQVGSEVSYNELSKTVSADNKTIEKYIDILQKCHIVFVLSSFSRNLRNELTKSKKIYFYDLGVRNAIINAFNPLEMRQDTGALWENFFIVERMKYNHYREVNINSYFWRTSDKQEIDYIEEESGVITAFELKWNSNKVSARVPDSFKKAYSPDSFNVVTPDNYLQWLIK